MNADMAVSVTSKICVIGGAAKNITDFLPGVARRYNTKQV
jgi:hypothetical protein